VSYKLAPNIDWLRVIRIGRTHVQKVLDSDVAGWKVDLAGKLLDRERLDTWHEQLHEGELEFIRMHTSLLLLEDLRLRDELPLGGTEPW